MDQFKLPDVGEGLTEAEIVSWKVKPGDTIKVNDIVCEIETAKSLVELPSPYAGQVAELLVSEGDTVEVGTPILSVGAPGEASGADAATGTTSGADGAAAESADGDEEAVATLVGYGPRKAAATRRPRKQAPAASTPPPAAPPAPVAATPPPPPAPAPAPVAPANGTSTGAGSATGAKVLAKPPVRKLAKDLGVDLARVTPTGPRGTISRDDVQAHAAGTDSTAASPAAAAAPGERETRLPIKGVRKNTAAAMVSSAFTAPHVTEWVTIDATRTMEMVQRLRGHRDFRDVKVSPLLVVARACCVAIRRTPEVNATWDDAAQEIVLKHYVNLGIAAATPRGLVVPNIKDADAMSAVEMAQAIGALTATAREGKTQPAEMAGGTFTITNVGVFGVDSGTPILNPGETGILAMGAIRQQPWVVDDEIVPRWVTTLALSFDHRVVDGEQGSRFLADVASIVEDPGNTLLF